jgi:hypothetical protein
MKPIQILSEFAKSKYGFDTEKELVIFGGRGVLVKDDQFFFNDNKLDEWNDCIVFVSPLGTKIFAGTVDPGLHFMKQPMNPDGTGRLESGILWLKRGMHRGYEALIQSKPALVRRDKDKDFEFSKDDPVTKGFFAANLHGASSLDKVGRSSAMCVVVHLLHTSEEFKELRKWIYSHKQQEFPCLIIEPKELALFIGAMK